MFSGQRDADGEIYHKCAHLTLELDSGREILGLGR